ncbi:hypothetical protein, partial [Thermococcus sp.]|uniref:hypothetical protein n=1 Tax=Thermococcus sp. TaxID=35749 RepID=UPI0026167CCB
PPRVIPINRAISPNPNHIFLMFSTPCMCKFNITYTQVVYKVYGSDKANVINCRAKSQSWATS